MYQDDGWYDSECMVITTAIQAAYITKIAARHIRTAHNNVTVTLIGCGALGSIILDMIMHGSDAVSSADITVVLLNNNNTGLMTTTTSDALRRSSIVLLCIPTSQYIHIRDGMRAALALTDNNPLIMYVL